MMLTYTLHHGGEQPLYEQLYQAIRQDILTGGIAAGEKLPSKRALSEHLNVSKITVETAYAQLAAEGYVYSRQRSGYFVEEIPLADRGLPAPAQRVGAPREEPETPASPSAELFPFSVWAKLMRGVILDKEPNLLQPVPNQGLYALREAIADDLFRRRGIRARPEQIIIGAGAEYFYNQLIQFFGRERVYGLETPGHRSIVRVYEANGARYIPLTMDGDGILPEELERSGVSVVHLSPSHHYPTGIVTPISRRQAIMRWLTAEPGRFLIEDDYDSEFRFSGRPIPTMQSMDWAGRVIYMNTFSKTIAPTLRISYMILPERLLPLWRERMGFYSCAVASFEQLTLTRFLQDGYFERHLSRMKKHYRALRSQLMEILAQPPISEVCHVERADAGLHFLLRFHTELSDPALQKLLLRCGLQAPMLSEFYNGSAEKTAAGCVVIRYADLSPETFRQAVTKAAEALQSE